MTYEGIMKRIKFHRERIDELSVRLHNTDNAGVRKAIINEMMWRIEEVFNLVDSLTKEEKQMYARFYGGN